MKKGKEQEVYTIENESDVTFYVQKAPVKTIDAKTQKVVKKEEKIFFLIGSIEDKEPHEFGSLNGYIDVGITKNEAEKLIETLQMLCKSIKG
ncbi:hypothetical protein [Bacteroides sp. 214]|uniref:hypothetical protein n=1 Tax=Bacteroides sp. 214 TaxID=2302935 RepID=UPI0013D6A59F|nr:hypothetical protein [Bacteroides sp. 214]